MVLFKKYRFKKYRSIENFLYRFTILKIGNLHIRLHKIVDKDRTDLYHNHPFNYISIILKGGYSEICLESGKEKQYNHKQFSIIRRKHDIFHKIDKIYGKTITLFIAWGHWNWNATNLNPNCKEDGIYLRKINGKEVWSKKENGIWYIGNIDKHIASCEKRHSIYQFLN